MGCGTAITVASQSSASVPRLCPSWQRSKDGTYIRRLEEPRLTALVSLSRDTTSTLNSILTVTNVIKLLGLHPRMYCPPDINETMGSCECQLSTSSNTSDNVFAAALIVLDYHQPMARTAVDVLREILTKRDLGITDTTIALIRYETADEAAVYAALVAAAVCVYFLIPTEKFTYAHIAECLRSRGLVSGSAFCPEPRTRRRGAASSSHPVCCHSIGGTPTSVHHWATDRLPTLSPLTLCNLPDLPTTSKLYRKTGGQFARSYARINAPSTRTSFRTPRSSDNTPFPRHTSLSLPGNKTSIH